MSSAKKVGLSFLITVLIFSVFILVAYLELFTTIETHFYQPSVISGMEKRLKKISLCLDEYTIKQAKSFSYFVELPCIKLSSALIQQDEDIQDREYFSSNLIRINPGLQGFRIIDSNGKKIFYSTFETDVIDSDFLDYSKISELPYEAIRANDNIENKSKARIIFDNSNERIIYTIPFYDSYDLYRGSAVFYVKGIDFNNYLIAKNILSISERAKLVATVLSDYSNQSKGFVLGLPSVSTDVLVNKITDLWQNSSYETQKIMHSEDYNWFVISDNSGKTGIISLVFKDDILYFSKSAKILFLVCGFITLFLITLLFFNIKQDDEAIIRDKIKKFKFALINEYLLDSDNEDWNEVSRFLAVRKHQINHDIKRLLGKKCEKNKVLVETLLEKTWNEVEQVIIYHEKLKEDDEDFDEINELELVNETEVSVDIQNSSENENSFHIFNKNNTSSISDLNFEVQKPDFGILDEEDFPDDDLEQIELFKESQTLEDVFELEPVNEIEELSEIEELVPYEDDMIEEDFMPEAELEELSSFHIFSLTPDSTLSFCSIAKLEELQSVENLSQDNKETSIVESATGIFSIRDKLDTTDVKIDSEFKNLVDSVLQNNV